MTDEEKDYIISCRNGRAKIIDLWGIYFVKFVTAINAGGVIAIMSFMGATKKVNFFLLLGVGFYLAGVILMGLVLRTLFNTHIKFLKEFENDVLNFIDNKLRWDTLCKKESDRNIIIKGADIMGIFAFIAFLCGSSSGVLSLIIPKSPCP